MSQEKQFFVYLLSNKKDGVLYIGVTSNLIRRIYEHKEGSVEGFTKRYHLKKLVYFEEHPDAASAITREKQMKEWKRRWKVDLIEKNNPDWVDLYDSITE